MKKYLLLLFLFPFVSFGATLTIDPINGTDGIFTASSDDYSFSSVFSVCDEYIPSALISADGFSSPINFDWSVTNSACLITGGEYDLIAMNSTANNTAGKNDALNAGWTSTLDWVTTNGLEAHVIYSHYSYDASPPAEDTGIATTSTSTFPYTHEEWLFVNSVGLFFLSLMSWRYIFRPVKEIGDD